MEKPLLDTLIDKTLQYLAEFKEEQAYVIGTSYQMDSLEMLSPESQEVSTKILKPLTTTSPSPIPAKVIPKLAPTKLVLKSIPAVDIALELTPLEQILELAPQKSEKAPAAVFPLHPPSAVQKDLMQDMRTILKKVAPTLVISSSIPSDEKAKKVKNAWKEHAKIPDVVILAVQGPSISFLTGVAKAIELHFFPSKVIDVKPLEQSNNWDVFLNTTNLKIIIAPDSVIWGCKHLMRYYHEFPNKKERYLGKIPLVLLPDPSLYIKDPSLKRSLWNLLCQVLKPLQR